MLAKISLVALMGMAVVSDAVSIHQRSPLDLIVRQNGNRKGGNGGNGGGGGGASNTCLSANAVQTGSASTGNINDVPKDGQVNSLT